MEQKQHLHVNSRLYVIIDKVRDENPTVHVGQVGDKWKGTAPVTLHHVITYDNVEELMQPTEYSKDYRAALWQAYGWEGCAFMHRSGFEYPTRRP